MLKGDVEDIEQFLIDSWVSITGIKKFGINPVSGDRIYTHDLRDAGRNGTLEVVNTILAKRRKENSASNT